MPLCPESVAASLHLASTVPLSSQPPTKAAAARIRATVPVAAQHLAGGKIRARQSGVTVRVSQLERGWAGGLAIVGTTAPS